MLANKRRTLLPRTAHKRHVSFSNILEVGVFPDCNVHRNLAYAVQQIIAQELEVERLRRVSMRPGAGPENATNPERPEIARDKSTDRPNDTKQPEKTAALLKERVSFRAFSSLTFILLCFNDFRCIRISSEMSLRANRALRSEKRRIVYPRGRRRDTPWCRTSWRNTGSGTNIKKAATTPFAAACSWRNSYKQINFIASCSVRLYSCVSPASRSVHLLHSCFFLLSSLSRRFICSWTAHFTEGRNLLFNLLDIW